MLRMLPGPVISASVTVLLALILIDGETFQPWPNSREAPLPVPLVAMPAWPFSPVKLSGLMERDCTLYRRSMFSIETLRPPEERSSARSVAEETAQTQSPVKKRIPFFIKLIASAAEKDIRGK